MRKEQTLLVVCGAVGALLVWGATGKYSEVGAASLGYSSPTAVAVVSGAQPDAVKGVSGAPLVGRAITRTTRTETRPPLPPLPVLLPLPPSPPRPVTTPGVDSGHYKPLRAQIPVVKAKEPEPGSDETPKESQASQPDQQATPPKPKINMSKAAQLVRPGGEPTPIRIELTGAFKGQRDWVLLEKWPNVTFRIHQLNKDGSELATFDPTPEMMQTMTVALAKTLENEYWEERIKRRVKDTNPDDLVGIAKWSFETLQSHTGIDPANCREDSAPYGIGAVKLAIADLKKALAIQNDLVGTKLLAEYCRAGYDLEGELTAWLGYENNGHGNDNAALIYVGEAYERLGAFESAKAQYQKAAASGDLSAKLHLGLVEEREGRMDAAVEDLKNLVGASGVGGKAALALARISLSQALLDDAAAYVEQAKTDGPSNELSLVQGGILYAQGKFAEAEKIFAACKDDDARAGGLPSSAWQSDRGIALLAKGAPPDLDEAKKAFYACLDRDPLNLLDPLFGLGDYYQRLGDLEHSNNFFETALSRSPDNPWILLRLAMIKLRDGQPEQALKLGTRLLEVAPGCDDGLWVVGRAAGSLATPDFAKAVSHLRRAVDKEPDNHEFINEYSRALISAGRVDEAMKTLDAATAPSIGHARGDARLLALDAWARFLAKKPVTPDVMDALNRGKRASPDEATQKWIESASKTLIEWDHTRIWTDSFERPASSIVGNGWREQDDKWGISVNVDGNRATFVTGASGVKAAANGRPNATMLDREEDLGRLKQMIARMKPCQDGEMSFSMHMGPPADHQGGAGRVKTAFEFGLGCDRHGQMVLWAPVGKNTSTATETILKDSAGNPRMWPMDDFHNVKIVRTDDVKGLFEIWFDDEKISITGGTAEKPVTQTSFEIGALNAQPGKQFVLGFIVDADAGAQIDAAVELVEVTRIIK